jgi:hypothetical protein
MEGKKFIEDRCGLKDEVVNIEDCTESAASCPYLIALNNPQPMELKIIESFNQNYIEKAKEFYNNLN